MDENGDAPEHPAVRWYRGLPDAEQFTYRVGIGLMFAGGVLIALGFGTISTLSTLSVLADKLGWSALQLGAAICIVQGVIHERSKSVNKPAIKRVWFELLGLYFDHSNTHILTSTLKKKSFSDADIKTINELSRMTDESFKQVEARKVGLLPILVEKSRFISTLL